VAGLCGKASGSSERRSLGASEEGTRAWEDRQAGVRGHDQTLTVAIENDVQGGILNQLGTSSGFVALVGEMPDLKIQIAGLAMDQSGVDGFKKLNEILI